MDLNKRIYFMCPVLTSNQIIELQKIVGLGCKFRPFTPNKSHLTVFHYGKPQELYAEISRFSKDLTLNEFIGKLSGHLKIYEQLQSSRYQACGSELVREIARGDSLDEFGNTSNKVLALRVSVSEDLLNFRSRILGYFKELLTSCGVNDTGTFMKSSENLKWQVDYKPHITLGVPEDETRALSINVENTLIELDSVKLIQ